MTNFKRIGVKATTALAMVVVLAASAVPTQAQANPNVSFSFNFGNGGFVQQHPGARQCRTNRQIEHQLENQGYTNVRFAGEQYRGYPQFYARSGIWLYTLQVNSCTGDVQSLGRQRARVFHNGPQHPHWNNTHRPSFGGGFGITFNHN